MDVHSYHSATSGLLPHLLAVALLGWGATAAWLSWTLKRLHEERRERAELLTALNRCVKQASELSSLRDQLNSHFLFNALNTIRYFVRTDTQVARGLLLDLSEFLKAAVDTNDCGTLGEELDRATAYLSLERARLGDRLELRLAVDEAPAGRAFPTRVLQPLVALLLKRGPTETATSWWIDLRCAMDGPAVILTVADNSPNPALPEHALAGLIDRLRTVCPGASMLCEAQKITLKLP